MTSQTKPKLKLSFDVEATSGQASSCGSMVMLGIAGIAEFNYELFKEKIRLDPMWETRQWTEKHDWLVFTKEWCIKEYGPREEQCFEEFWSKHPDVWSYIKKNEMEAVTAMKELSDTLKKLSETYDFSWGALPASFDWMWLKNCYELYGPSDKYPIGFKAECFKGYKTIADMYDMGADYDAYVKPGDAMTHYATDDAIMQGYLYLRSKQWIKKNFVKVQ